MDFLESLDGGLSKDPSETLRTDDIFSKLVDAWNTPEWLNIKKILSKHKCLRHVEKEVRKEIHKRGNITDISPEEEEQKLIRDTIKDSPAHGLAVCPRGWALRDYIPGQGGAIQKALVKSDPLFGNSVTKVPICSVPMLIIERLESIADDGVQLRVAYRHGNTWRDTVVPQNKIFSSQHIVEYLGNKGVPITSNTKSDVIDYLCAYLDANYEYIPATCYSNQMGWVGTKKDATAYGFLCGENFISNQAKTAQHKRKVVRFLGNSSGDEVEAKAISAGGSYEGWLKTIEGLNLYPRAEVALYASLSSVLLEPLKLPGYVVDWSYRTSRGKTTILKVAASVWGRGEEFSADSPIKSWNTTKVGAEMLISSMNNLPVILDDTKQAPRYAGVSIVPSIIYSVYNGRGRARGTKSGGSDVIRSWRTVLLSTGEQSVTDFDKSEGTATRALCIGGEPFNRTGETEGAFVDKLASGLCAHYGHAGPKFLKWVIANRQHWPAWSKALAATIESYRALLSEEHNRGVSGRIAKSLGLIEFTARLAHQALGLPWGHSTMIRDTILEDISHGADQADQAAEALKDIMGWCVSNKNRFDGHTAYDDRLPKLGKWEQSNTIDDWDKIYIISKDAKKELENLGYDSIAVLKAWKHAGITVCDERRTTTRVRFNGVRLHCVCLAREQVEGVT